MYVSLNWIGMDKWGSALKYWDNNILDKISIDFRLRQVVAIMGILFPYPVLRGPFSLPTF